MTETTYPQPGNGSAGGSFVGEWQTGTCTWLSPVPAAIQRTRKVAILGFAETVKDAPINDPSWELVAMNGFHRAAKPDFGIDIPEERYSAWIDMHTPEYIREYGERAGVPGQQEEWLGKVHPFPIYMIEAYPGIPSAVAYPLEDVIRSVGRDYFTSTVAYAIALYASQPDVAEIGLWGIDLAHDTEYADQRPCAEYHLARAEGLGIKVTTHEQSALMRQLHRYGYEEGNPLMADLRKALQAQRDGLVKTLNTEQSEIEAKRLQVATNDGARQLIEMILSRLDHYERGGRV